MKKFALALVLVLAFSISAFAAAPVVTGSLTLNANYTTGSGFYWGDDDGYFPTFDATLGLAGDNYKLSVGFEDPWWTGYTSEWYLQLQDAYLKTSLPFPGTLSAGQLWDDDSDTAAWIGAWYDGTFGNLTVNASYALQEYHDVLDEHCLYPGDFKGGVEYKLGEMTLKASYQSYDEGWDTEFFAGVNAPIGALTVDAEAGYSSGIVNDDTYGKVTYKLSDALSFWGKYVLNKDWSVGSDAKLAGIDFAGKYAYDEEGVYDEELGDYVHYSWKLSAEKALKGITYSAETTDFESFDFSAKVEF